MTDLLVLLATYLPFALMCLAPFIALALLVGWAKLLVQLKAANGRDWQTLEIALDTPLIIAIGVSTLRLWNDLRLEALLGSLCLVNINPLWALLSGVGFLMLLTSPNRARLRRGLLIIAGLVYGLNILVVFLMAFTARGEPYVTLMNTGVSTFLALNVLLAYGFLILVNMPRRPRWLVTIVLLLILALAGGYALLLPHLPRGSD